MQFTASLRECHAWENPTIPQFQPLSSRNPETKTWRIELQITMVKVLENKVIDLDLLPGQAQIDLQRQFRTQIQQAQSAGSHAQELAGQAGESAAQQGEGAAAGPGQQIQPGQIKIPVDMLPDSMSDEQKEQARGIAGTIVDASGNVLGGLAGTVGGVLKGVGDTGANVVYDLGSGLGGVGMGVAGGLKDVAQAPFAGSQKKDGNARTASAPIVVAPESVTKDEAENEEAEPEPEKSDSEAVTEGAKKE